MSDRMRLHPGMHALSPEMAIGDVGSRDHGHGLGSQCWPRKIANFLLASFVGADDFV